MEELIIDDKKYLVDLSKLNEINMFHEFGEVYHLCVKVNEKITGEIDFYFECYELETKIKKFKVLDFISGKVLFLALRRFCFNNQSMRISSDDLNEKTGKKEFKDFIDRLNDDNLSIDDSSKDGYVIYLFDNEESFNNIKASIIEKKYKQNELEFIIKEFN